MTTTSNRVWFRDPLETVATFWRVLRKDGVTIGLTSHNRDLRIDDILHRATPGMVPSSIRRSADFEADSAEVQGALSHASLSAADLANGCFDAARVLVGLVDWSTGENRVLYRGTIASVSSEDGGFSAELHSAKAELARDPVPRTSPSCRAEFCGPGCTLSAARFSHRAIVAAIDPARNAVAIDSPAPNADLVGGRLRWLDGPQAGTENEISGLTGALLTLDRPLDPALLPGRRVLVREGCDRTVETCAVRFANAANFQGEPYLPGNDLLARYPAPSG